MGLLMPSFGELQRVYEAKLPIVETYYRYCLELPSMSSAGAVNKRVKGRVTEEGDRRNKNKEGGGADRNNETYSIARGQGRQASKISISDTIRDLKKSLNVAENWSAEVGIQKGQVDVFSRELRKTYEEWLEFKIKSSDDNRQRADLLNKMIKLTGQLDDAVALGVKKVEEHAYAKDEQESDEDNQVQRESEVDEDVKLAALESAPEKVRHDYDESHSYSTGIEEEKQGGGCPPAMILAARPVEDSLPCMSDGGEDTDCDYDVDNFLEKLNEKRKKM